MTFRPGAAKGGVYLVDTAIAVSVFPTRRSCADETGGAVIEMAAVTPVLLILMFSILQFGVVVHNRIILEEAVGSAARTLALTRGTANPCSTAAAMLQTSKGSLTWSSITRTLNVHGSDYTGDTCSGAGVTMLSGEEARVTATYPWAVGFYGMNAMSGTFTSTMSVRVE